MNRLRLLFASTHLLALVLGSTARADASKSLVYIGTYTQGSASEGIYLFHFDDKTGQLTPAGTAGLSTNPSFLAVDSEKNLLFAVGETRDFNDDKSGSIASFKIDPDDGKLTEINRVSSYGGSPCHIVTDRAGKHLLVANYHGGNVAAVRIGDDGRLGERTAFAQHEGSSVNKNRQEAPHAHSINLTPDNQHAFAADLGTDELVIYDFDKEKGTLGLIDAVKVNPGSGPRHLAVHSNGRLLYLLNELSSTISIIQYSPEAGAHRIIQEISTLPEGYEKNNGPAEIQILDDRFVYASNRGHDSIACYKIGDDGKLSLVEIEATGGEAPRNFGIHPSGKFLIAANQNSDTLKVFAIDQQTGELSDTGHAAKCPKPVCVKFHALKK